MTDRDFAGEVRDALYKCHGLRAWTEALQSGRPELIAYVEETTGGLQLTQRPAFEPCLASHMIFLCGVRVAAISSTVSHLHNDADMWTAHILIDVSYVPELSACIAGYISRTVDEWLGGSRWVTWPITGEQALALYGNTVERQRVTRTTDYTGRATFAAAENRPLTVADVELEAAEFFSTDEGRDFLSRSIADYRVIIPPGADGR